MLYLWAVIAFTADRVSKAVVSRFMTPGESLPVVEGILHLTYVRNPGAAFGLLTGRTLLLTTITVIMVGGILWWHHRSPERHFLSPLPAGLLVGGALGNLTDRIFHGAVTDFFDLQVWPVFNVADIAIVVGSFLLALHVWRLGHINAGDEQAE